MVGSGLFSRRKDTISVSVLEDTLFLHPPSSPASPAPRTSDEFASQEPTHDPILRGQVSLVCSAPRKARRIRVELVGRVTRHGGDGSHNYESSVSLDKHLEIDLHGERLERGTHTYDFSFIIPSSTAVGERSNFGTVRHTVRAVLVGVGTFQDLVSMPRPVYLIANPAAPGDLPSGLEIDVRHTQSELGPISLHISSPHLTVASLIFLSVCFEQPPEGMKIMSVQAFVRQEFEVHYSDEQVPVSKPPMQRKLLFYIDSSTPLAHSTDDLLDRDHLSRGAPPPLAYEPRALLPQPLARLEGGKEWMYARVTRIPDDDSVRPTTLEGTDTPIRVKHQLVCQVRYRFKGSRKDQVLEMASAVTIASCCCLTSSLLLPEYRTRHHASSHLAGSSSLPSSGFATPSSRSRSASPGPETALSSLASGSTIGVDSPTGSITPFHRRCLCNTPLQKLVDQEGERLCGAAAAMSQSRSRSRAPGDAAGRSRSNSRTLLSPPSSGFGTPLGSRSTSELLSAPLEIEHDEASEHARGRARDVARRAVKAGETYPVPREPYRPRAERGPCGGTGAGGGAGMGWEAQAAALRPVRAVEVGSSRSLAPGVGAVGRQVVVGA
ncbi:hypothetical protein JCM9279_002944 [Rhodotorula babjevae]